MLEPRKRNAMLGIKQLLRQGRQEGSKRILKVLNASGNRPREKHLEE
jgi:hypothetical protein